MELLNKLQVKDQKSVFVLNVPDELQPMLTQWATEMTVLKDPLAGPCHFVLIFTKDKAQLEQVKPVLKKWTDPKDLIWIVYPKKTSKNYDSDLSRDDFWDAFKDLGLRPVRQIALNDDWSALRFRPGDANG